MYAIKTNEMILYFYTNWIIHSRERYRLEMEGWCNLNFVWVFFLLFGKSVKNINTPWDYKDYDDNLPVYFATEK